MQTAAGRQQIQRYRAELAAVRAHDAARTATAKPKYVPKYVSDRAQMTPAMLARLHAHTSGRLRTSAPIPAAVARRTY